MLLTSASCIGCDQTTKSLAQSYLRAGEMLSFLGDTIRLQLAHNSGAFLSVGSSLPEFWRFALFDIAAGALLLGLLAFAVLGRRAAPSSVVAMALLVAGGLSNLLDRLTHAGYVVDFINVGVGPVRTGIFNVADMLITTGVIVLLVNNLAFARAQVRNSRPQPREETDHER
jgi:signal peptidase II